MVKQVEKPALATPLLSKDAMTTTDTMKSTIDDLDTIRTGMQELHDTCINHSYKWRLEQLNTMEQMVRAHQDDFIAAIQNDLGCTAAEASCLQYQMILMDIATIRTHLVEYTKPKRIATPGICVPAYSELIPMPLNGPAVLIIGPSNYPLSLCLQPAAGALAAGNPVVLKPSEHCPHVANVLEKYIPQYFARNVLAVIQGDVPETTTLVSKPWGLIFFTGSPAVGKIIAAAAAKTLTPTVLELGGKTPCIIDPDTCSPTDIDLTLIANRLLWAKLMNSGQTCAAVDTLIMNNAMCTALVPVLIHQIQQIFGATKDDTKPLTPQTEMGKIVTKRNAKRLLQLIEQVEQYIIEQEKDNTIDAKKRCRIVYGGSKYCNVDAKFIAPTIILNPPLECDLMQQEIFGPILPILTFEHRTEILQFVKTSLPATPLCLYVFTSSDTVYQEYSTKIRAGSVMRNDCLIQLASPYIPFGGLGTSGYGTYHGPYTLETFTHWTPSMYRPLLPGSDLNNMRHHPFVPGTLKHWLVNRIYLLPSIPVLYLPELCTIAIFVVAATSIGASYYFVSNKE